MCVCNWPSVHEVCQIYEVVMFQPQTLNPMDLGSVTIVTNIIYTPPAPPVSTVSGLLFSIFHTTAPP